MARLMLATGEIKEEEKKKAWLDTIEKYLGQPPEAILRRWKVHVGVLMLEKDGEKYVNAKMALEKAGGILPDPEWKGAKAILDAISANSGFLRQKVSRQDGGLRGEEIAPENAGQAPIYANRPAAATTQKLDQAMLRLEIKRQFASQMEQLGVEDIRLTTPETFFDTKHIFTWANLLFLIGGAADGTAEALKFHYSGFRKVFPNANEQFWNPALSWTNKYMNGNPDAGERFFLSTSALVGATDGYHAMRSIRNLSVLSASLTVSLGGNEGKKWYHYLRDVVYASASYALGFGLTYGLAFGRK